MLESLLKAATFDKTSNAAAGAATDITTGDIIDLAGYDSVLFVASLGTVVDASVTALKAYTGNAADLSDGVYESDTAGITASTSSNKLLILDVVKPGKRYVRADLARATQNAALDCIIAIRYNSHAIPATQGADVAKAAISVN